MSADLAAEQQQAKHSSEAILWTQPYFIYSALNNDTSCYGLAVSGGTPTIGTQIILWSWQGGQTSELWAFNGGQFVSNLGSNLVLGFGDPVEGGTPQEYYLVLVENNQSDQSQFWNMNPNTGLISNAQYPDRYVNVAGGLPTQGANIITYANQPGAANEMFILAPWFDGNTQQQPTWCYLQSELSDQNGQIVPYVLTVLDGYENGVLNVGLNSLGASGTPAQMWQYTKDRRLLNGSGTGNVLMPSYAWINGFERVAAARQLNPTTNLQHWGLEGKFPNMLNNWHTGQNIYVPGGSPYGNPTLELRPPPANTDDTGFFWYPMPSSPLNAIIAQAPQPFGFFSGDQLTAYQYINQQLNLGQGQTPDLRGQYLNVAPGATNEEMLL